MLLTWVNQDNYIYSLVTRYHYYDVPYEEIWRSRGLQIQGNYIHKNYISTIAMRKGKKHWKSDLRYYSRLNKTWILEESYEVMTEWFRCKMRKKLLSPLNYYMYKVIAKMKDLQYNNDDVSSRRLEGERCGGG